MTEFPKDIMNSAEAVRALVNDSPNSDAQANFIAAAILAERQRCVEKVTHFTGSLWPKEVRKAAQTIIDEINGESHD